MSKGRRRGSVICIFLMGRALSLLCRARYFLGTGRKVGKKGRTETGGDTERVGAKALRDDN